MTPKKTRPLDLYQIASIGLMFFAFLMAALFSRTVFERLPHLEDELAYIYQARIFARGDVVVDIPELRRPLWQPFVVDYQPTGNRFGKYAPGWPLILALGFILGQPWVINAFFAMLGVGMVYRLGREVFNPDVGLMAAALMAFSPMALLLNATLMSHSAAIFTLTLFMFAYWRIMQRRNSTLWAVVAGLALGVTVINRPFTAAAATLPFILWSGLRVLRAAYHELQSRRTTQAVPGISTPEGLLPTLRPQVILALITVGIGLILPLFNYAAVGDPTKNLYTLVWEYDRVGFGACCGRSSQNEGDGHTIIKGIRHTRFDLSLTAADLFGWQVGGITPELQDHLRTQSNYWPRFGLSFFLLPLGLLVGLRGGWLKGWLVVGMGWLLTPFLLDMDFLQMNSQAIWGWLAVFYLWMLLPPFLMIFKRTRHDHTTLWTWMLLGVIVGVISLQLAYWVGSQRYSTRYYSETLMAFALLSALPLALLARRTNRALVYGLLALALAWSLFTYSIPRINALYQFNRVSADLIQQVEARRSDDRPVLVIVSADMGNLSWRAYGALMALTDPYLENDIIAAWDHSNGGALRAQIIAQFPQRQIIDMQAQGENAWFSDEAPIASPPPQLPPPFAGGNDLGNNLSDATPPFDAAPPPFIPLSPGNTAPFDAPPFEQETEDDES